MPFSLRLDEQTQTLIDRLSRRTGRSRASIVREAVAQYGATANETLSAYQKLEPIVGVVKSGRGDLSRQTGRRFTEPLKNKRVRRARRAR